MAKLLFFPAFSTSFIIIYVMAGISDMIDGTIARKTNTADEFGSGFDTIADIVFTVACMIKLLPVLTIPTWICIWICVLAIYRRLHLHYCYFGSRTGRIFDNDRK